jgi:HTH-type transcriptional regulator / antitoxin HipB
MEGADGRVRIRDLDALGRAIRAQRKKQGMTLVQAAGLAGVGVRFLHELEHGKPTASLGKALQVLQRIGVDFWIEPRQLASRKSD